MGTLCPAPDRYALLRPARPAPVWPGPLVLKLQAATGYIAARDRRPGDVIRTKRCWAALGRQRCRRKHPWARPVAMAGRDGPGHDGSTGGRYRLPGRQRPYYVSKWFRLRRRRWTRQVVRASRGSVIGAVHSGRGADQARATLSLQGKSAEAALASWGCRLMPYGQAARRSAPIPLRPQPCPRCARRPQPPH
jgi:hypothetical protein